MIAADHDGGLQLAAGNHIVEHQPRLVPISQTNPANAGGQALKRNPVGGHIQPIVQMFVIRKQFLHRRVGFVDILRIARQGHPAERADPFAKQGPDIGGHKTGESEGVFQPFVQRHLADVVAVIQRRHARIPEINHG